ncbi:MAG: hypothetical protein HY901_12895 [Deltaproteobacteria bacterium]|nr:hypothetical protein [Deltaproteobacteria bacterium]
MGSETNVLEFQSVALGADGRGPLIALDLPVDVRSVLVEMKGKDGTYYLVDRLEGPDGTELVRPSASSENAVEGPFSSPNRSSATLSGTGALLVPNTDTGTIGPGRWQFGVQGYRLCESGTLPADGTVDVKVHIQCGKPLARGKIDLQVNIPAIHGWKAADAEGNQYLAQVLSSAREHLKRAGLDIGKLTFRDIDASFATASDYALPEGMGACAPEELFKQSDSSGALSVFLLKNLYVAGNQVGGLSGGIPGPASPSTSASGVAVSLDPSYRDPKEVGKSLAHEIGHYLGLSHTFEADLSMNDAITDTPEGTAGRRNLMYFEGPLQRDVARLDLSAGQARVVLSHPLVHR